MRRLRAASGPYAAELKASRPKMGMPWAGAIFSARSSLVRRGLPTRRSIIFMRGEVDGRLSRFRGALTITLPGAESKTEVAVAQETPDHNSRASRILAIHHISADWCIVKRWEERILTSMTA